MNLLTQREGRGPVGLAVEGDAIWGNTLVQVKQGVYSKHNHTTYNTNTENTNTCNGLVSFSGHIQLN